MNSEDDEYSPEEIAERMGRALKRALSMPPKPQRESSRKKRRPARKRRLSKPIRDR